MAGNMLEDFVNGRIDHPRLNHIPLEIKNGIRLHRFIDTFTDNHQLVKEAKLFFAEEYGKYSGILIDVYFDHFLLKNWSKFTYENFDDFKKRVYNTLPIFDKYYPPPLVLLMNSMITHDWLGNYLFDWGLERAFLNLNKRLKQQVELHASIPIFRSNYEALDELFIQFFTEIKTATEAQILNYKSNG